MKLLPALMCALSASINLEVRILKPQFVTHVKYFAIMIVAAVVIVGCTDNASDVLDKPVSIEKNVEQSSTSEQKKPTLEDKHQSYHEHKQSKPGAAVSLRNSELLYVAGPGVYEFQLELVSTNHDGKMVVEASATDGLTILSSTHDFEFELSERGGYTVPLVINAAKEGRFYIQLKVSIASGQATSSRVIAAIVQVGESAVKAKKAGVPNAGQNEETVISLPAQETILPR